MTRTDVQKLYRLAGGRWWDPFRAQWELVWARNAVRDLDSLLRRYVTPASNEEQESVDSCSPAVACTTTG